MIIFGVLTGRRRSIRGTSPLHHSLAIPLEPDRPFLRHRHLISKAITTLRTHGATVIPETDIEPIVFDETKWHRLDDMINFTEIKASLKEYFEGLEKTGVRSLGDVIQ